MAQPQGLLDAAVALAAMRVLSDASGRRVTPAALDVQELRRGARVCRVQARGQGTPNSLIVKRLSLGHAERAARAMQRWLPAVQLGAVPPALLGVVAPPGVEGVWHLYEDLGPVTLHARQADRVLVGAAVAIVAELHVRGAGHPLVAECRAQGRDFGMHDVLTGLTDARRLLDELERRTSRPSRARVRVRDGLRRHLDTLLEDAPRRARIALDAGGPETMLHGDLWTTNVIVTQRAEQPVRLIDWDRAGAGPIAYDLSTLLLRFAPRERRWVLDAYREAVGRVGWRLPAVRELNVLCDTAECGRYAGRIVECAIAALHDGADWADDVLAEVLRWFEALTPVIPDP